MHAPRLQGFHLSTQQARVWSLHAENPVYHAQCALHVEGVLSLAIFLQAIELLVERQSILRTTLSQIPGMDLPLQVIQSQTPTACTLIDLQHVSPHLQDGYVQTCFALSQQDRVDLTHSPLLRLHVLRLSRQVHIVLLRLPALCADESTLVLLASELSQTYSFLQHAQEQGRATDPQALPEPLQYVDVAAWQNQVLLEEAAEPYQASWRTLDLSPLATMALPLTAEERSPAPLLLDAGDRSAFCPQSVEIPLEAVLAHQIQMFCHQQAISCSTYVLTCWALLLSRLTSASPLLLGVACDGRVEEELATACGPYTRVVPVGLALPADLPFVHALTLVQEAVQIAAEEQGSFTWQDVQTRQEALGTLPFFPLSFEATVWPERFAGGAVAFSLLKRSSCSEPFALKVSLVQMGEQIQIQVHADPRRMPIAQVRQIATMLRTVVQAGLRSPQTAVSTLPLIAHEEQAALVHLGGAPTEPRPALGVHQLFEWQALLHPQQIAVLSARQQLTYQQLNEQANHLARVLQHRGVGPHALVGLCMQRQASLLVGLLAILKAGAAYLPLDPTMPQTRLHSHLQESGAVLLLTQHAVRPSLPMWAGETLCLEDLEAEPTAASVLTLAAPCDGESLAYVIYTSGSTGAPKGVMVRQSSVVNYTLALCDLLGAEPGWHYATVSTLAADLGNTAIFCALASGGCVQILDEETITSGQAMAHWVIEHPIDVLKIVPSHLSALLEGEHAQGILPRRALITGGEVLSGALVQRLRDLGGTCQLYNHYGPTETTIGVLVHPLGAVAAATETPRSGERVPLGRPLSNTEAYLLDERMQLVPLGATGELYLAGAGLARGYLQQPAQTAERFVPHPFSQEAGARLYRTGDLMRMQPEGSLQFVGRRDGQVKLRGYRIELGEIEAVLRRHPQVRNAVVLLREDPPAEPRLVSYVVARHPLSHEQMSAFVRQWLPDVMVPTSLLHLDALPLTANGKVDRRRLPAPESAEGQERSVVMRPQGPIEELVVGIWQDLLAVPGVGRQDNFFALGGHSLLATRLMARMQTVLSVAVPMQALFEAPTVAAFAQRVEQALREHEALPHPPLVAQSRPQEIPLSYAQQRLWFLDQLEPGSSAYLVPMALRLQGPVDAQHLERAFEELICRHESLRTTFEERAGQPVQVIHPACPSTLPVIDLHWLGPEQREQEARQLASEEAQHPCDLIQGPLLRTSLLRMEKQEHVLLLTLHHIITDGWSNGVLVHELTSLYRSLGAGQPSALAPLPIQYADYALWQRGWLQGEILDAHLAYWRTHLAEVPALELPTDHPRPAIQTSRGAVQSLHLSGAVLDALGMLSRQEQVTLFMTLLAALQVLLQRYSGQDDFSVGTPIANRGLAEIEGVIGFVVNTLVLRADLSGNPTFTEVLQRVRAVCLGAYAHQDVPFEQVVEALAPRRDLSRSPLFQVMLVLQNVPQAQAQDDLAGIQVESLTVESTISKFDLTLSLTETENGLAGTLEYNRDLFEAETITRLLDHWQILLEGIVHNPQMHLADLPLLTAREHELLLEHWNATRRTYPQDRCVHQLFEEQVQRTPEAVALLFKDETLTYAELNRRANQLAHYLQTLGVGPDVLVGIGLERSIEMVLALLAVLKAGGGYAPLDPQYPEDRLAFIIADAHLQLLLMQQRFQALFASSAVQQVWLDTQSEALTHLSDDPVESSVGMENLAYVLYTSGSTGRPKGVMISHRALGNHMRWMHDIFPLLPEERLLQKTSFSFDASVWEVYAPLLCGASLILATPEGPRDSRYLIQVLQEQAITRLQLVPSQLRILLEEPDFTHGPILQHVFCGGEALSTDLATRFFAAGSGHLHNLYGPTETTIDAICWQCQPEETGAWLPIGRPIANIETSILDTACRPVPVGVVGELYLAGVGLARGYLGRPDLTAEKFLPHPFAQDEGSRLYRTGDQARYRADGVIEYLGRMDQQVKIRGHRIELGEIEAALRELPVVQDTVVLVREDVAGDQRLVAYVVLHAEQMLTMNALRTSLQDRLPTYMLPTHMVVLAALPLTSNGKIDRKALPAPEELEEYDGQLHGRTPIEEVIEGLWSTVLGRSQIGIHDNFFELGGHSLLATQLLARVRATLGREIPLRALFEEPTVAGFARRVEHTLRQDDVSLPPLVAQTRHETIPLSYAQQRLWFLEQLEPGGTTYLLPSALNVRGEIDLYSLERAFEKLIDRHESLRTTFEERADQPMQVIHPTHPYILPMIDLHTLGQKQREQETRQLANQEAQRPCDLIQGPLLRTSLLRLQKQEHVLLLTLHHIITDGWSNGILVHELTTLYRCSLGDGQPTPLAPLPIQYADYALWQRDWLQGEMLEAHLAYWRTHLTEVPPLEMPTSHPRPAVQTSQGAIQSLQLSVAATEGLTALSRQEHVTLFMTLLATFQVLLQRYSGQDDFGVGTPIANRRHAEIEGLIGFFVNTLVLRTDLSGNPTFTEVLQRVREVCLGAYAHQDVPFEQVVEALAPARDLSRSPLFQVMLILQNTPQEQVQDDLAGMRVASLMVESTISKFDLTLSVAETGQGLHCTLEYNTDLFEAHTITRLLGHWQTLLEGIVQHPQAHLSDLPLLTAEEHTLLLAYWNATATWYPQDLCVHQLFEQQVQRTPEAVALVFKDETLTYACLNQRANQLAHSLQTLGVGPEVLVGICLERSIEMVVALLAILKAGGAYVPLDPSYPQERLTFIVADAHVALLLTSHLPEALEAVTQTIQSLDLGRERHAIAAQRSENPHGPVCADNLAYVIYTSGSTGKPKGTMVLHRNVSNFFTAMDDRLGAQEASIWLAVTSISFDISVLELLWTLARGFQVVVRSSLQETSVTHDPDRSQEEAFAAQIQRQGITHLQCTPSQASLLLTEPEFLSALGSLRMWLLGGEALSGALLTQIEQGFTGVVHNMYGPTETTIWSLTHRMQKSDPTVVIGRPIANTQVYLLDPFGHCVPVGVAGELLLGGKGVVRGYLNRADLTAEKFLPDPWSAEAGACLYRTGDLARYLPDGTIEYLGRMDQQVKIRGYRIELGEIETVLREQPGVREAVVQVREDAGGQKWLVAYVVSAEQIAAAALRRELHEKLPAPMVPARFQRLDALPLTPNGKVDRKRLPAPDEWEGEEGHGQQRSRTPIEEVVQGLWSTVLGRTQIGIDDNFFELGGHSLLAIQLLARVRTTLGVEITLRTLFEEPTVAGFARRVEHLLLQRETLPLPPLVAKARPEELPLSYAQQRLWFLEQLEPGNTAYLVPNALNIHGVLETQHLQGALHELMSRHESLRTTFEERAGQPVQVIHPVSSYTLPIIDLQRVKQELRTEEAQKLASQEAQRLCDLAQGPLLRASLLRLENQEHMLLLTLHHIITDGWSDGVLLHELTTLYHALVLGQSSPLALLPIQYADYALWQRQWLQGEILQQHIDYWKKQLWMVRPLKLPTDAPYGASMSKRGAIYPFHFPTTLSQDLVTMSRQEGVTLFMLLLAAFQIVLYRSSGQEDIVVGTDVANRAHIEVEGLIGFFVNLLALRTEVQGTASFRDIVQQVRAMVLGAYAHQELPFDIMIEHLPLERRDAQTPVVQVLLVLQNTPEHREELPGLTFEFIREEHPSSKFDIALFLYEEEEAQGIGGNVVYRAELFKEQTIATLVHQFEILLRHAVMRPELAVDELEIVTEEEKMQHMLHKENLHRIDAIGLRSKKSKPIDFRAFPSSLLTSEKD